VLFSVLLNSQLIDFVLEFTDLLLCTSEYRFSVVFNKELSFLQFIKDIFAKNFESSIHPILNSA